ncbi:MAG: hypothetical protein ABIH11_02440 [Candidatus Altiarchaeota archaeon]
MDIDDIRSLSDIQVQIPIKNQDGSIGKRVLNWDEYMVLIAQKEK